MILQIRHLVTFHWSTACLHWRIDSASQMSWLSANIKSIMTSLTSIDYFPDLVYCVDLIYFWWAHLAHSCLSQRYDHGIIHAKSSYFPLVSQHRPFTKRKGLVRRHYSSCSFLQKSWGTWIYKFCSCSMIAICKCKCPPGTQALSMLHAAHVQWYCKAYSMHKKTQTCLC